MPNHDKLLPMTEQEAVAIFELPEVLEAQESVRAHFREADAIAARGEDRRRTATAKAIEVHAMQREADAKLQAEGGRVAHVAANQAAAEAKELAILAALEDVTSERETLAGEMAWAEVAAKYNCYVPSQHRLEARAREHPGMVYCYDTVEGEMGLHAENQCPQMPLRRDSGGTKMLRRRTGQHGRLSKWPGRKD